MNFLDSRLPDRFWSKVMPEPNSGCWLWIAGLLRGGYGAAYQNGRQKVSHRVTYEAVNGPVPPGLDLDHLCRVRACCNPAHVEPVTRRENLLRGETIPARHAAKTHCDRGHELAGVNIWINRANGARMCKECSYLKRRERMTNPQTRERENAMQRDRYARSKGGAL